jgi:hypothetical protein
MQMHVYSLQSSKLQILSVVRKMDGLKCFHLESERHSTNADINIVNAGFQTFCLLRSIGNERTILTTSFHKKHSPHHIQPKNCY